MDKDSAEHLEALSWTQHQQAEAIMANVADATHQGTMVITNNLLQQLGGPSPVPGLIASAQVASRVPAQGML